MKELSVVFKEKIERTATVKSFRFIPKGEIVFAPGQFLQVIFDAANRGNKELNKYLSFSCSPAKDYIEITKRLSESAFSRRLEGLKSREEVLIKAPMGNCVFREEYKKIAFLIGGIGITPVISIIEYIMDKGLDTDALLFYSNRTEEEIAFKDELTRWAKINSNLKIVLTVTDCQPIDSSCIFGRIDAGLFKSSRWELKDRLIFIFGPPLMVKAMTGLCLGLGCSPEALRTENFVGY